MNDNHPNPRPLWKMSDAELSAIVNRRASIFGANWDDRAERALEELRARAEDRANLPDDTPSLDPPWWAFS